MQSLKRMKTSWIFSSTSLSFRLPWQKKYRRKCEHDNTRKEDTIMGKISEIEMAIAELRSAAEAINDVADSLAKLFGSTGVQNDG